VTNALVSPERLFIKGLHSIDRNFFAAFELMSPLDLFFSQARQLVRTSPGTRNGFSAIVQAALRIASDAAFLFLQFLSPAFRFFFHLNFAFSGKL